MSLIPAQRVERIILVLSGHKVILDRDLADLYEVETRALVQAVQRNSARFADDFIFHLTDQELTSLRS